MYLIRTLYYKYYINKYWIPSSQNIFAKYYEIIFILALKDYTFITLLHRFLYNLLFNNILFLFFPFVLISILLGFFYFIFKLYIIVLVLPNIKMNLPQVYMCSPSWTLHPPPTPYHPSGSSQCTSPKHPVSCIEPGLSQFVWIPFSHPSVFIPLSSSSLSLLHSTFPLSLLIFELELFLRHFMICDLRKLFKLTVLIYFFRLSFEKQRGGGGIIEPTDACWRNWICGLPWSSSG